MCWLNLPRSVFASQDQVSAPGSIATAYRPQNPLSISLGIDRNADMDPRVRGASPQ